MRVLCLDCGISKHVDDGGMYFDFQEMCVPVYNCMSCGSMNIVAPAQEFFRPDFLCWIFADTQFRDAVRQVQNQDVIEAEHAAKISQLQERIDKLDGLVEKVEGMAKALESWRGDTEDADFELP